jgi:hypothetical protein
VTVPTKPRPRLLAALDLTGRLLGVALEVAAGGVEEQQIDLEVEQVRHGEEHRLLNTASCTRASVSASISRSIAR